MKIFRSASTESERRLRGCLLAVVVGAVAWPAPGGAEPDPESAEAADPLVIGQPLLARPQAEGDFDLDAFRVRLHAALDLTADQVILLRDLRAQLQIRLEETREAVHAGQLTHEEGRASIPRIMHSHRAARQAALSPDQISLLERAHRYLAERRMEPKQDRPHRGRHLARLAEALRLTPEQAQEWRALLESQRAAMQEPREGDEGPTREDIRLQRLHHKEAFEAILSLEQLARFRQIEDRWRRRGDGGVGDPLDDFGLGESDPATFAGESSWGDVKEGSR